MNYLDWKGFLDYNELKYNNYITYYPYYRRYTIYELWELLSYNERQTVTDLYDMFLYDYPHLSYKTRNDKKEVLKYFIKLVLENRKELCNTYGENELIENQQTNMCNSSNENYKRETIAQPITQPIEQPIGQPIAQSLEQAITRSKCDEFKHSEKGASIIDRAKQLIMSVDDLSTTYTIKLTMLNLENLIIEIDGIDKIEMDRNEKKLLIGYIEQTINTMKFLIETNAEEHTSTETNTEEHTSTKPTSEEHTSTEQSDYNQISNEGNIIANNIIEILNSITLSTEIRQMHISTVKLEHLIGKLHLISKEKIGCNERKKLVDQIENSINTIIALINVKKEKDNLLKMCEQ